MLWNCKDREHARKWWAKLTPPERWQLGDDLVLGCFDWREWGLSKPPSRVWLREVDYLRVLWESE